MESAHENDMAIYSTMNFSDNNSKLISAKMSIASLTKAVIINGVHTSDNIQKWFIQFTYGFFN